MSEVRVKEMSLSTAHSEDLKDLAQNPVYWLRFVKENTMKSLLSDGRKSLRLHANANIDKVFPREKAGMLARFFLYPVL